MALIQSNTLLLPVSTLKTWQLRQLAVKLKAPMGSDDRTRDRLRQQQEVIVDLTEALIRQEEYNRILKLALDDSLRLVQQRIDQRPKVGVIAERPDPDVDGWMYLSTDETPPTLYVAADNTWITV